MENKFRHYNKLNIVQNNWLHINANKQEGRNWPTNYRLNWDTLCIRPMRGQGRRQGKKMHITICTQSTQRKQSMKRKLIMLGNALHAERGDFWHVIWFQHETDYIIGILSLTTFQKCSMLYSINGNRCSEGSKCSKTHSRHDLLIFSPPS